MSKHVLIAEDDELLSEMMGRILTKYDVRITIVSNGQEAIEVLEREAPDLVLLDILMPIVDGFGVLKVIRERRVNCHVVVVSNLNDKITKEKCHQMNVQEYFVKNDMDDDDIWPAIEKYLR